MLLISVAEAHAAIGNRELILVALLLMLLVLLFYLSCLAAAISAVVLVALSCSDSVPCCKASLGTDAANELISSSY
ncbi:hypothetical protein FRX31_030823 [Thalictrum thalictroides]|uniref:Transmembrane protein n=1 Tax=Thalictrum thalictroides TaxID=46969 RepID=A0A7J6V5Y6_THATH|nr:hypothetical protein FRX31_030823 [Thalictrum thalictroides]